MSGVSVLTLAAAVAVLVGSTTARADVVFTDTFDSGTGNWYKSAGGTASNQGSLTNASGELSWAISSADLKRQSVGRAFAAQTLANDGDKLQLTFDWKQTNNSASLIRVGLFDIAGTIASHGWLWNGTTTVNATAGTIGNFGGYYSYLRDNNANNSLAAHQTGTNIWTGGLDTPTEQTTTPLATPGVPLYNLANDGSVTYDVLFEVERVSATQVITLMTISSGATTHLSVTGTHNGGSVVTSFDSVVIRQGPTSGTAYGTMLLDNIQLEYVAVPEPASLSLALLGFGLMMSRRRSH